MTAHPPLLRTETQIATARRLLQTSEQARRVAQETLTLAERWAALDDDRLRAMAPPTEVPRAFNTSFDGCPVHGRALFDHGNYSWRFDPFTAPWKLVCPVGGETYPSNDFGAFLAGGMQDRSLLTGPYADDGWGWTPPEGSHRHWFVAYYCHWLWMNHLIPATLALGRAYLLTGEPRFAHKAGVLLEQIAGDYPRMDHNRQSRYATEFLPSYTGKIVNAIWETGVARDLAEAWDAVALAVEDDRDLGPDTVHLVENNLLREALAAIPQRRILGNYGMHQQAAIFLALALGDPAGAAVTVRNVLHGWSGLDGFQYEGLVSVLDNLFSAEGLSYETAPGYCSIPSNLLPLLLEPMRRLQQLAGDGRGDALQSLLPRLSTLVSWPRRLVCLDRWTPAIGDSGGAAAPAVVEVSPGAYRAVAAIDASAPSGLRPDSVGAALQHVDDLFAAPAAAPAPVDITPASDVLTDYGLAILRSGRGDTATALTLHYGRANAGHAHADRLNVEFFGAGRTLIPDLGYPQFAAEDKTARAWDRNTGSHCVVAVDGRQQQSQNGGRLLLLARSPWLQAATADAPAYPSLDRYERTLLLVGDGEQLPAYAVDLFRIRGGARHDYRLHGPDLPSVADGLAFGEEQPGTLAGPDVPVGFLWDDPELEQPDRKRAYDSYDGCGDSFLYGVRTATAAAQPWRLTFGDDAGGLCIHVMPTAMQTAFLAWGDVPRRPGNPERLRHLILRREGPAPLDSLFATVLEPLAGQALIGRVTRRDGETVPGQLALKVDHAAGSDVVLIAVPGTPLEVDGMRLDGHLAVLRYDPEGLPTGAFLCGTSLRAPGLSLQSPAPWHGIVTETDQEGRQLIVRPDKGAEVVGPLKLEGCILSVDVSRQQALILSASRASSDSVQLTLDRPAIAGRLVVERTDGETITTRTTLYPPFRDRDDIGAHLEGTWLRSDGAVRRVGQVRQRPPQGHVLTFHPGEAGFSERSEAKLLAWRAGARVVVEPVRWWPGRA